MHSEREHRPFSPSQADRNAVCLGSVNLLRSVPPRPSTIWAIEGTKAHEVLEAGLRNSCTNATQSILCSIHCCEEFDIEFKAAINEALSYVWEIMTELNMLYGDAQLFVETYVNPPSVNAPGQAAGHCDIAIYSAKGRILYVIDYKHGAGIAKAVVGNRQVKQYAAGFLYGEPKHVDADLIDKVILVIIQPRSYHPDGSPREYETTPFELYEYLQEMDANIAECLKPDAPLVPDEDICRFCDARPTCPAIEAKALQACNVTFASVKDVAAPKLPDPRTLDVQRLSYIKHMRPLVEMWFDSVDTYIKELVLSGQGVPGFKAVEADPRREWYDAIPEEERAWKLAALIGCDFTELYRITHKPLTDVEAMLVEAYKKRVGRKSRRKAAEDARQMFAYFTLKKSSGNVTIVEEADPRPPVNRAAQLFGQVNILPPPTIEGNVK